MYSCTKDWFFEVLFSNRECVGVGGAGGGVVVHFFELMFSSCIGEERRNSC